MIKQFEKQAQNFEFERILALIKNWGSLDAGNIIESLRMENRKLQYSLSEKDKLSKIKKIYKTFDIFINKNT
jgi:hypothetical protein